MKRSDAVLAALVVASLSASAAVWSPFWLPARVDVAIDAVPPRVVRAYKPTPTPKLTPTPTPTQKPTKATPTRETDWAEETEKAYLQHNKLYTAGRIAAVDCVLPTAALVSKATMGAYIRAMMACLDRAWVPLLERAGHYVQPAELHLVKRNSPSPCGPSEATAFYCSADRGIYIDSSMYLSSGTQTWRRSALLATVSHEYGHHVQMLAGILTNSRAYLGTGAAQLEASRRMELQASCFGMAFIGANQRSLKLRGGRLAHREVGTGGDEDFPDTPRDHGSRRSVGFWEPAGFRSKDPGSCNTWAASPKRVS